MLADKPSTMPRRTRQPLLGFIQKRSTKPWYDHLAHELIRGLDLRAAKEIIFCAPPEAN